jgi:hypothetical protein
MQLHQVPIGQLLTWNQSVDNYKYMRLHPAPSLQGAVNKHFKKDMIIVLCMNTACLCPKLPTSEGWALYNPQEVKPDV